MAKEDLSRFSHLVELLRWRSVENANDRAVTYLVDGENQEASLTYHDLDLRARAVGAWLQSREAHGKRVLLLYPPGLDYLVAYWGCLYAGAVAVPAYPPRRQEPSRRLESVISDAKAEYVFATQDIVSKLGATFAATGEKGRSIQFVATESISMDDAANWTMPAITPNDLAFLQYTSGSTSAPKGVMVSHGCLMTNEAMIRTAFEHEKPTGVSWLPMYHDMGLIGGILHPIYAGGHAVLMSPTAFIQRPVRWLQAISKYRADSSGGPNFSYDFCVQKISAEDRKSLDLSSWTVAFNGAEPIRAETLRRFTDAFSACGFSSKAFFPCYGLAEATLLVSGGPKARPPRFANFAVEAIERHEAVPAAEGRNSRELVSNGPAWNQTVKIVDPENDVECSAGRIGEVWVSGPNIAKGYWGNDAATAHTFQAKIADTGEGPFMRTGDLGFIHEGELFITGRNKDLMIIRGRNHYPQDIEQTVESSHPALRSSSCAAFSVDVDGEEQLVIVQEVERSHRTGLNTEAVFSAVLQAVIRDHLIQPYSIVLIDTLTLLKTSSGKIQRRANRQAYMEGQLQVLAVWVTPQIQVDPFEEAEPVATVPELGSKGSTDFSAPGALRSEIPGFDNTLYPTKARATADELILWVRDYAGTRLNSRLIDERRTIPPYVVLDLGNRGLMGMQIPTEYGGLGLGAADTLRLIRQLGALDQTLATFVGLANILGNYPILRHATQPVRERMLPLLATGREMAAFAITEPGAGSNPGAIQSRATADGAGRYLLHGEKSWIGLASWAGVINVFVREQASNGNALGISGFTLRQGTPGLRQGPEALTMGMRGMVQNTVYLEGAAVSDVHRLGSPGAGMTVAQDAMMFTRLAVAAGSVGSMQRAAQLMMRYAGRREVATGRLLHNPVTRLKLSTLTAATDALDTLVMQTAQSIDKGVNVPVDLFTACKIAGPELAWAAMDDLSQMLGGRGYIETNLVPQMIRDVRLLRVFEGPTETLRMFLGARVVNQPNDLMAFLAQQFGAQGVATRLQEAAAQVSERVTARHRFEDESSGRQWVYSVCGELATYGLLMAAAHHAFATTQKPRYQRAQLWADAEFQRVLAEATSDAGERLLMPMTDMEELIASYEESIGDVEQTLAGEQQGLDEMLRRDLGTPPGPAPSPIPPPVTVNEATTAPFDQKPGPPALPPPPQNDKAAPIRQWMIDWMAKAMRLPRSRIDVNKPFAEYGMDSIKAVEFAQDLETWLGGDIEIEEAASWKYPTIAAMAGYIVEEQRKRGR